MAVGRDGLLGCWRIESTEHVIQVRRFSNQSVDEQDDPVCDISTSVDNPGLDLDELLDGQPLLIAVPPPTSLPIAGSAMTSVDSDDPAKIVKNIRGRRNNSWSNLRKAGRRSMRLSDV